MNRSSLHSRRARRFCFAWLLCLPLAGACGEDDAVVPPPDLSLTVTLLDGTAPDASTPLRCDGTLAVQVDIAPARSFTLRPPHACGRSTRCGYLRFEALDGDDGVLATSEEITALGLLELDTRIAQLARVRVTLLRGLDQEPVQNGDRSVVSTSVDVDRSLPDDCDADGQGGAGGAGQGGAGGGAGQGGADDTAQGGAGGAAQGGAGQGGDSAGAPPAGGSDGTGDGGTGGSPDGGATSGAG